MKATDDELAFYLFQLAGRPDALWEDTDEYTKEAFRSIVRKLLNAHNFGVPWNRLRFP